MGLARARLRYALRIRRCAHALGPFRQKAQRRARAAVQRGRAHGGRGWRRRDRDFEAFEKVHWPPTEKSWPHFRPSAVDFCRSRLAIGAVTERARALAMPAGTRAQALQTRL